MAHTNDAFNEALDADMMFEIFDTVEDRLAELDDIIHAAKAPGARDQALLEITRLVHSLKGMTRAFGLLDFSNTCHAMEDALADAPGRDAIAQAALYAVKLRLLFDDSDQR